MRAAIVGSPALHKAQSNDAEVFELVDSFKAEVDRLAEIFCEISVVEDDSLQIGFVIQTSKRFFGYLVS